MARVSLLQENIGPDPKPLFDRVFIGDSWNKLILVRDDNGDPLDLTNYNFLAKGYKFHATVPDGPIPNITNYTLFAGDSGTAISITKAENQDTNQNNRGKITILVPTDIFARSDGEFDSNEDTPVLVIYIKYTDDRTPQNTRTKRIVLAYTVGY